MSYRPARLHSLAELVPRNLFLGSLKVKNSGSGLLRTGMLDGEPRRGPGAYGG
jgi:hypothetical protein